MYRRLGVDILRTHDAGLPGFGVPGTGDIDGVGPGRIFPDWQGDPDEPASYNFAPTDALLANVRALGAEVYFRVGRSATGNLGPGGDGSGIFDGNYVPDDFDKYADVVRHVVMHYNKGWANGFEYGIRYFEIWNEPDFLPFWAGTGEQYHELYGKLALAVKSVDQSLLVGGPANAMFNDRKGTRASFLQYLSDNQLPLDFYSFHRYTNSSNDPLDYARIAQSYREELDRFGFTSTRIINSEYGTSLLPDDPLIGGDAGRAAFAAQALIFMQDAPVDRALSYMILIGETPSKESLGFEAISRLKETPSRLWTEAPENDAYAVLAGTDTEERRIQVVVSRYQISPLLIGPLPGERDVPVEIPGVGPLGTFTLLERRTPEYSDTDGYELVIDNVPDTWGAVRVEQYRIDRANDLTLVGTEIVPTEKRQGGRVSLSGEWAHAEASPPADPNGVAQGVDVIVIEALD